MLHLPLWLLSAALLLFVSSSSSPLGTWEGPFDLGLVAVSAANLPDGSVLFWAASNVSRNFWARGERVTKFTIFFPWNNTATPVRTVYLDHDMFCPGTAVLPDGRIFITGGHDDRRSSFYDPSTDAWTRGPLMNIGRGYHTMVVLADGQVFTLGGSYSGDFRADKKGELYDPGTNTWKLMDTLSAYGSLLTNDSVVRLRDNHYRLFPAPNGLIFHAGPSFTMHWIDLSSDGGSVEQAGVLGTRDAISGNAVMYDVGKILTLGGAPTYFGSMASGEAYTIDINSPGKAVGVARTGDLNIPRGQCNSVVLPNGHVLVFGGMPTPEYASDLDWIAAVERWDPATGVFTVLSTNMTVPRNYHSTALLLKDGRVVTAGGGMCGECAVNHLDAEIYTPPYLFNSEGSPVSTRPEITRVEPATGCTPPCSVTVEMGGSTADFDFVLMRQAATTHAMGNEFRRIPLRRTGMGGNYTLHVPEARIALPGMYFLFALDAQGVPSVGESFAVLAEIPDPANPDPANPAPVDVALIATLSVLAVLVVGGAGLLCLLRCKRQKKVRMTAEDPQGGGLVDKDVSTTSRDGAVNVV